MFPKETRLIAHDWAASDALCSAEWAAQIFADFPNAEVVASDSILHLVLANANGQESFVLEPQGAPLQYIHGPLVVNLVPSELHRFPLLHRILRAVGDRRSRKPSNAVQTVEWKTVTDEATICVDGWNLRKVMLIHPEVVDLGTRDSRFRVVLHDVFTPLTVPCNLLRTMNIFNLNYFTEERLREGIRSAFSSLSDGGLWIVGRTLTADRTNHATIYRKEGASLRQIRTISSGSEIHALVAEMYPVLDAQNA